MSKLTKFAMIMWVTGMLVALVACVFGMCGVNAIAIPMLIAAGIVGGLGVLAGWTSFTVFIWND